MMKVPKIGDVVPWVGSAQPRGTTVSFDEKAGVWRIVAVDEEWVKNPEKMKAWANGD